ncbi:MAG: hypothetical protein JNG88_02825 [Phycisphaerales bacterium]|nr:hypothetical protein [Phycisphaerales bacterium]
MRTANTRIWAIGAIGFIGGTVFGADAATTAGVTGRGRDATAVATANYTGEAGFARTNSRSGEVNQARGIAVGFDENGLALSLSNAVEHRGLAVASNFNINIDRDGDVSTSSGVALARGGREREVSVGGATGHNQPVVSTATARTERGGLAHVVTRAEQHRARPERVIVRRMRGR